MQRAAKGISSRRRFYDSEFSSSRYANWRHAEGEFQWLGTVVAKYLDPSSLVLDVGSGRAWYRSLAPRYVALDLTSVSGQYADRFVCGSAEDLPFADGAFDCVWSITVLEHIPDVERALGEMVRVLKPGGVIAISAAWRVPPWRPLGVEARLQDCPHVRCRILRVAVLAANYVWRSGLLRVPLRLGREVLAQIQQGPYRLHYAKFAANLEDFLLPDSDACSSIDNHEAVLWLHKRGVSVSGGETSLRRVFMRCGPIVAFKGSPYCG